MRLYEILNEVKDPWTPDVKIPDRFYKGDKLQKNSKAYKAWLAKQKKINEDAFGVPTPTPEQVAAKHGVPIEQIFRELDMGIKAEMEHTLDKNLSAEIALDHLSEMPDYYTQLEQMEKGS